MADSSLDNAWVDVSWMPHSSLSQASHVTIRIAEIISVPKECAVQVTVLGMGALEWTIPSGTAASTRKFNQVLHLPIRWRDLARDATLSFQIMGPGGVLLYQNYFAFFDTYGRMKTGLHRLPLTSTSDCQDVDNEAKVENAQDKRWSAQTILYQLDHLTTIKPQFSQIQSVPWLDAITRHHCQEVLRSAGSRQQPKSPTTEHPFLVFELPRFDIPILHEETLYPKPKSRHKFADYETPQDNPAEDKYRTLAHDLLRGLVDPALKPDREQRDRLAAIIASPSHHPTREEKDLLWRFRFSLVDNRRALTKFLLAVDWTVESEVVQAAELLEQWRKRSPIEVTDALKLLGKNVAFQTSLVRSYAIDTLAAAPDHELSLYLLQLVQAIKYETMNASDAPNATSASLAHFLIERAANNIQLATSLYWYLKVELQDQTFGPKYVEFFSALQDRLSLMDEPPEMIAKQKGFMSIVSSKLSRSTSRTFEDDGRDEKGKKTRSMWDVLDTQDNFITGLMETQLKSRDARGKKDAKEQNLRETLAANGFDRRLAGNPVPLPSAPQILVDGVYSQNTKMFKSALYPAVIEFRVDRCIPTANKKESSRASVLPIKSEKLTAYKVIVKTGDDLRQDQLVIMMTKLMDRLLKRGTLDLCLTPYSVIAMSSSSGLIEFVEGSMPISAVLANHNNSVMQFFQAIAPQQGAKYNIRPDVMSTYVRSCAGYCVITYLLGVGDRHLDNIMLKPTGHFFHIDFGFIFGRDPKPLPPAFRLTREMVDGMGGLESSEYRQFCSLACQAFNTLRKSAGLVLNLLHLMSDAGIEDLSNNPAADTNGVISSVEARFKLELTDEQAERFFLGLINDCLVALAPRVMDVFHSIAVSRR